MSESEENLSVHEMVKKFEEEHTFAPGPSQDEDDNACSNGDESNDQLMPMPSEGHHMSDDSISLAGVFKGEDDVETPLRVTKEQIDNAQNNAGTRLPKTPRLGSPLEYSSDESTLVMSPLFATSLPDPTHGEPPCRSSSVAIIEDSPSAKSQASSEAHVSAQEKQNAAGLTPLCIAARKGFKNGLQLLLERGGGDINAPDKNGRTPLHHALDVHDHPCINLLLHSGARLDVQDKEGTTPLHLATSANCVECVAALLEFGGSPIVEDAAGRTALHIATSDENIALMNALTCSRYNEHEDSGIASTTYPLEDEHALTCRQSDQERARHMRIWGQFFKNSTGQFEDTGIGHESSDSVWPDGTERSSSNALHAATWRNDADAVVFLLDCSTDVNSTDESGNTALHIAASNGHMSLVHILLQSAASVDSMNRYGETPMYLSLLHGHQAVASLLKEYGARTPTDTEAEMSTLHRSLCVDDDETLTTDDPSISGFLVESFWSLASNFVARRIGFGAGSLFQDEPLMPLTPAPPDDLARAIAKRKASPNADAFIPMEPPEDLRVAIEKFSKQKSDDIR